MGITGTMCTQLHYFVSDANVRTWLHFKLFMRLAAVQNRVLSTLQYAPIEFAQTSDTPAAMKIIKLIIINVRRRTKIALLRTKWF